MFAAAAEPEAANPVKSGVAFTTDRIWRGLSRTLADARGSSAR